MMFVAHNSDRYGYLSQHGSPIPPDSLARRCGCDSLAQYETLLAELLIAGVPSQLPDGTIFSRRMVKDHKERKNGKERGDRLKRSKNGNETTPAEGEDESEILLRIGGWFGRRKTTPWTEKEMRAFRLLKIDPEDMELLNVYYSDPEGLDRKMQKDIRRRDLITLLNNWPGEVDKARTWVRSNHKTRDKEHPDAKTRALWDDILSVKSGIEYVEANPTIKKDGLMEKIRALPKEAWAECDADLRKKMEEFSK